jgi:hypothetical protein
MLFLSILERLARRRRRAGASPIWTAAAFAAFLLRTHQRRSAKDAVVLREELKPGQSLLISHTTQRRG